MAIGIVTPSNAVANVCGLLVLLVSVLCGGFLLNKQEPEAAAGGGGSFVARRSTSSHRGINKRDWASGRMNERDWTS